MKSLASLLSRAFLDHLLENPVGWQFIYRKHDPITPSITMTPTNFVIADLTPHARNSHVQIKINERQDICLFRLYSRFSCLQSSIDCIASPGPPYRPCHDYGIMQIMAWKTHPSFHGHLNRLRTTHIRSRKLRKNTAFNVLVLRKSPSRMVCKSWRALGSSTQT